MEYRNKLTQRNSQSYINIEVVTSKNTSGKQRLTGNQGNGSNLEVAKKSSRTKKDLDCRQTNNSVLIRSKVGVRKFRVNFQKNWGKFWSGPTN
jgi:hypothetical protein